MDIAWMNGSSLACGTFGNQLYLTSGIELLEIG